MSKIISKSKGYYILKGEVTVLSKGYFKNSIWELPFENSWELRLELTKPKTL